MSCYFTPVWLCSFCCLSLECSTLSPTAIIHQANTYCVFRYSPTSPVLGNLLWLPFISHRQINYFIFRTFSLSILDLSSMVSISLYWLIWIFGSPWAAINYSEVNILSSSFGLLAHSSIWLSTNSVNSSQRNEWMSLFPSVI